MYSIQVDMKNNSFSVYTSTKDGVTVPSKYNITSVTPSYSINKTKLAILCDTENEQDLGEDRVDYTLTCFNTENEHMISFVNRKKANSSVVFDNVRPITNSDFFYMVLSFLLPNFWIDFYPKFESYKGCLSELSAKNGWLRMYSVVNKGLPFISAMSEFITYHDLTNNSDSFNPKGKYFVVIPNLLALEYTPSVDFEENLSQYSLGDILEFFIKNHKFFNVSEQSIRNICLVAFRVIEVSE